METNPMSHIPSNLEEIKMLLKQFEVLLPPDKKEAIWETLNNIEENGGIQNEQHGKELVYNLLQSLGLEI